MIYRQNIQQQIGLHYVLLCGLLCLFGCDEKSNEDFIQSSSYAINKPYYKGPLRVQVCLSNDLVKLSDLVTLELSAEIDTDYEIRFPTVAETLKQFRIRNHHNRSETLSDKNKIIITYQYQLEPLELGMCEIPAFTFSFEHKEPSEDTSARETLVTEPVWIDVSTSLSTDPNDFMIADIDDVVELKANYFWLWIGLVIACLLAAGVGMGRLIKPKKTLEIRRIYRSAHEIAFLTLKAISKEMLIDLLASYTVETSTTSTDKDHYVNRSNSLKGRDFYFVINDQRL
jgi:hypothetical protein